MTHTWQTMREQPHGFDIETRRPMLRGDDGKWSFIEPPHAPGERVPVREEWMPGFMEAEIHYRDGTSQRFLLEPWFERHSHWALRQELVGWQPADTMPDFAVRKWREVVSCVPVQAKDVTEEQAEAMGIPGMGKGGATNWEWHMKLTHGPAAMSLWGWLTTYKESDHA